MTKSHPKDEIADIRKLLLDQNERILKLESENLDLKRDNADLREQLVGVAKKEELFQNEVVHLRRQLSEIKEQLVQNKTQNSKITEPPNDTSQRTNIKNRKDVDMFVYFYRTEMQFITCSAISFGGTGLSISIKKHRSTQIQKSNTIVL